MSWFAFQRQHCAISSSWTGEPKYLAVSSSSEQGNLQESVVWSASHYDGHQQPLEMWLWAWGAKLRTSLQQGMNLSKGATVWIPGVQPTSPHTLSVQEERQQVLWDNVRVSCEQPACTQGLDWEVRVSTGPPSSSTPVLWVSWDTCLNCTFLDPIPTNTEATDLEQQIPLRTVPGLHVKNTSSRRLGSILFCPGQLRAGETLLQEAPQSHRDSRRFCGPSLVN